MKRIFFVLSALLLSFGVATAQKQNVPSLDSPAVAELKESIGTWVRGDVIPQLRTWKESFDRQLAPADLEALNALRARATVIRTNQMNYMRAMAEAWRNENYDALKENREKSKVNAMQGLALLQELAPIAQKYRPQLEALGAEAKPTIGSWKQKGKEIFTTWAAEHPDAVQGMKGLGRSFSPGGLKWMEKLGPDMKKKMHAALFLLWDGADITEQILTPQDGSIDLK